jgi:outer membrane protein OmpA-like peptidoglycan-associated protein
VAGETDDIDELLAMLVDDERPAPVGNDAAVAAQPPPAGTSAPGGGTEQVVVAAQPGGHAEVPVPAAAPAAYRPRKRRRSLVAVLAISAVVNLVALVLLALWWTGRDSESTADGSDAAAEVAVTATTTNVADTAADTSTTASIAPATTADGTITSVAPTAENPTGAVRYAVFAGGQIHLRGLIPSQELADQHVAGSEAIMGPGSVVSEYVIDPNAPAETDQFPVYLEDVVLFGFNSVDLDPQFLPLLDTTPVFLATNPNATVTVIARTDSVGSEELNLEVAGRRAQAVIDYWVSKGVDPARLIADPRGEEAASGNEGDETAAYDRRVEFVLNGLLG